MTTYPPLVLPPPKSAPWENAKAIVLALRALNVSNPVIVAAVVNGFAESWWSPTAIGDHGQSYGPWQLKAQFYHQPILDATGIDITDPKTTLEQHVSAVMYALELAKVIDALDAAKTGADATRIWAQSFERASAGGAVERRVALAGKVEVWLAGLTP